jgi:hypothetical protein
MPHCPCARSLGSCRKKGPQLRRQPVARLTLLTTLIVLLLGLTACPGGRQAFVQLAKSATSKVSGAVGREAGEIKINSSEVSSLASQYGTSSDDVTAIASKADTYQGWSLPQESIDRMAEAAKAAKDNKAVSAGVGVACDWMTGNINSSDQFQSSLAKAAAGMTYSDWIAFREASTDLATQLKTIRAQGSPQDKVAAALLCYAYQVPTIK